MKLRWILGGLSLAVIVGCGGIAGPDDDDNPDDTIEPYAPVPAVMARLTADQYRNTVADLFGEDVPAVELEADTNPYLFYSIGAASTQLSELGAQQYSEAARTITTWIFEDTGRRDALLGCTPSSPGDGCVEGFLKDIGLRLFRRPLTGEELDRWLDVSRDKAVDQSDRYQGAQNALYGMLQSPSFLYRVELGERDPNEPAQLRYTNYEMAQRVSFLLWNTSPDPELLAAADRGELSSDEGLHHHARRLLESPRARGAVQAFFSQYFDLNQLEQVDREPERFPMFSDTMARSMRTELELLVDDFVFRRDADLRDLFSTRRTYVNSELATLYGVDAPGATPIAFVPVELPADGPRAGVLTFGAFLTMNAHRTETSPTRRGKFVRERVLCEQIQPPPDGVDFNLEDPSGETKTLRERLEQHRSDPFCASCHKFMDPPGFLFENFDSVGAYRTVNEGGYELDTSGELDGIPLANARDLAEVLPDDPRVAACIVKQLYRHANARLDAPSEREVLLELETSFADSGYRFQDLLIELVLSRGFRVVANPEVSR